MLSPSDVPNRIPLYKYWLVLFALTIAVVIAGPNYLTGQWLWKTEVELTNLQALRSLQESGISVPGWHTVMQQTGEIGGRKWSIQGVLPEADHVKSDAPQNPVWILLRPQPWHRDMPQVDWMDINGAQKWTTDSVRSLHFTLPHPKAQQPISVWARFLRGWTQQRTYAVVQWYAWADGGSPAPRHWFWADQRSQLFHRTRTPWVAVSLLIPIKPLGDIETARSQATQLGELVQTALVQRVLSSSL